MKVIVVNKGNDSVAINEYENQAVNETTVHLRAYGEGNNVLFQAQVSESYPGTAAVKATLIAEGNHISVTKN